MDTQTRPNTFIASITDLNDGATVSDLDRQLREVVMRARETGKPGSITLTLTIEPRGADSVIVVAKVTEKMPKQEEPKSIFFVNEDGALVRDHPKQTTLPFKAANAS